MIKSHLSMLFAFKSRLRLSLLSIGVLLGVLNCSNELPVSGNLTPPTGTVVVDTIALQGVEKATFSAYSGNLSFYYAGVYSDPNFGDIQAKGVLKPTLFRSSNIDTLTTQEQLVLELRIDNVYGDTTSAMNFDIFEIDRNWRGNELLYSDDLTTTGLAVGSFSVRNQDSVLVRLSDEYLLKYKEYVYAQVGTSLSLLQERRDSLYYSEMFGLAIVPRSTGKIVNFRSTGSRFLQMKEDSVLASVAIATWGTNAQRTNVPNHQASDRIGLYSDYEEFAQFVLSTENENGFQLEGVDIPTNSISRAELVFFEDPILDTSYPEGHIRDQSNQISFYSTDPDDLNFALISIPSFTTNRTAIDFSYRINLTNFLNQFLLGNNPNSNTFFINSRTSNGMFATNLLYGVGTEKQPIIIITYVQPEEDQR